MMRNEVEKPLNSQCKNTLFFEKKAIKITVFFDFNIY